MARITKKVRKKKTTGKKKSQPKKAAAKKSPPAKKEEAPEIPEYDLTGRPTRFANLAEQGKQVERIKFKDLVAVCAAFGVNPEAKSAWHTLRGLGILNLRGFKVHPTRGGEFNQAFLSMPAGQRRKWAEGVLKNPPVDQEWRVEEYKGKIKKDEVQVFWDLVTIANMPKAVGNVPMFSGHFRGREAEKIVAQALKSPKNVREKWSSKRETLVAEETKVTKRKAKTKAKAKRKVVQKGQKKAKSKSKRKTKAKAK